MLSFGEELQKLKSLSLEYTNTNDYSERLSAWSGYFKKTLPERQDEIKIVFPQLKIEKFNDGCLPVEIANIMIENCIGILSLPIGICPNFIINGQHYIVPMAIEEPSIIAACSSISKLIAQNGGFFTRSTENIMISQIQILDLSYEQMLSAINIIKQNEKLFIDRGNEFCSSMTKRGGGIKKLVPRIVNPRNGDRKPYLVIHIYVNVCEAMGANIVNTIAEGLSEDIVSYVGGRVGLRILTNLCVDRRAISSFRIPIKNLGWKGVDGQQVAERIIEAYQFALDDEFRATTNNKGVMNGIDATCLALGQDFRAIESAAHAFCCKNGYYGPMAHYKIVDNEYLVGTLELPMAVGSKGGALGTHSGYRLTHELLGNPNAKLIGEILVSVGLAQNFGAIRALAVEGIQRGHMALHAKNIASSAGVPSSIIDEVATYMINRKQINCEAAKHYMEARKIFLNSPRIAKSYRKNEYHIPSTFYIELPTQHGSVSLNIVMATRTKFPIHLEMKPPSNDHKDTKKK